MCQVIKFLAQHKMVDVIVTTAGGIEEDIMKCFEHTFMGDFKLAGKELRKKGINRCVLVCTSFIWIMLCAKIQSNQHWQFVSSK